VHQSKPGAGSFPEKPNMVFVEGGIFQMGNFDGHYIYSNERPMHQVRLNSFYIDMYEITNEEFIVFLQAHAHQLQPDSLDKVAGNSIGLRLKTDILADVALIANEGPLLPNCGILMKEDASSRQFELIEALRYHPVAYVTWYGARAYCRWKNKKGRLPSEAEWEYAARGGKHWQTHDFLYAGSDSLNQVGWYWNNSGLALHKVGEKKPNQLGIYDMSGNMWEWVEDHWHDNYQNAPDNNRPWVDKFVKKDKTRVLRGGAYLYKKDESRNTSRWGDVPDDRHDYKGFRCVCET
jgi:formylglycine-generating enzyme required for sulfatase activity